MSNNSEPMVEINEYTIEDVKTTLELDYVNERYYLIIDSPYLITKLNTLKTSMYTCRECKITNVNIGNVDKRFVHVAEVNEIEFNENYAL